jgi:polyketide cyclase/dehydrase/lipid transport protein
MSLHVCPIAHVRAPVKRVWGLLYQPANFAEWWDAKTKSIEPKGPAQAGQRIHATSMELGLRWNVDVLVEQVDEANHSLDLMTTLPLGIILFNHIMCKELDAWSCQVSFSREFSFSPVWWGWVLERFADRQLYASVATALTRLKAAAEKEA